MNKLFQIGGTIPKRTILMIEIAGLVMLLLSWYLLTMPQPSMSIGFDSSTPAETKYHWTGPNGFEKDFPGDNMLISLVPGTYFFTATAKDGAALSDSITVPKTLDKAIVKNYKPTRGSSKFNVDIEIAANMDGFISKGILPPPGKVLSSFPELINDKKLPLFNEVGYSVLLNTMGYVEAVLLSIILGFLIGLVPFFRALMSRWVNAIRFVPLTAVTGLFIAWFGIEANMKVQFLAFGIFVYLLPVVVQRVDDVLKIYLQTAFTLGASKWQLIRTVYLPSVASKIIDDVRVLTAISWTYIIIAEVLNQSGGVGALIHISGRNSRLDKVFALLIVIVLIGIIQDLLFKLLDKLLFKFKYQGGKHK